MFLDEGQQFGSRLEPFAAYPIFPVDLVEGRFVGPLTLADPENHKFLRHAGL